MRLRPLLAHDEDPVKAIYARRGYKFDLPKYGDSLVEDAFVVESESGEIIAAGFAIRTPEIVLLMGNGHPVVKLEAIQMLHVVMRDCLRRKGYKKAWAVVSPALKSYVRHMKRKFGWIEDFPAYRIE